MTGNLVFFEINHRNCFIKAEDTCPKYIAGTLYGGVFVEEIYTLAEIKVKYPDIKEVELVVANTVA